MKYPLFFYKFVSFERKDILENGLIRFSPIGEFNDPFELEPTITPYSRKFVEHWYSSDGDLRSIDFNGEDYRFSSERSEQVGYYKELYKKEIGKYGVLSLSSNKEINQLHTVSVPSKKDPRTNILMWSHYADSHKGFVIEFFSDFIDGIELKRVDYSNSRGYLTFEDVKENSFSHIFYSKSSEWSYEQEYRAVLPLKQAYETKDGKYHLYKIKKSCINSITFGCAMSESNKASIMSLINKDKEFQNVKHVHACLADEGFFLDFYADDGRWTNNPDVTGVRKIPIQKKF
ncbi:DUF2971 domain-containing protein [Agarivorans sp. QJM3NY_25]|uniref:DUF2971 domain-containing protein n=1 Tax=Agarivorans sp. QJM3NY_25 TaxID=3421430 RepID=UPI003D7CFDD9